MKRSAFSIALAAGLSLAAVAAAQQAAARPAWRNGGETIEMTMSWLAVKGGTATITFAADGPERMRITSLAQSNAFFSKFFKVRDQIDSVVERDTLSTLRYHKMLQERSKFKEDLTVVDPQRNVAIRKDKEVPVVRPIYDPLSIIFLLRTLDLGAGKTYSFNVVADGKVYPVAATVMGREVVATEAGSFRCVLVEPKMRQGGIFRDENSRLQIWFSDDTRHIPVRIRSEIPAGSITASLRSYRLVPLSAK